MRQYLASDPTFRGFRPDHDKWLVLHNGDPVKDWVYAQIGEDGAGFVVHHERDTSGGLVLTQDEDQRRECRPVKHTIHVSGGPEGMFPGTLRFVRDTLKDVDIITDVSVAAGKYRLVQSRAGTTLYRHGLPWRDATGDGCMLAFAQQVEAYRDQLNEQFRIETARTFTVGDLSETYRTIASGQNAEAALAAFHKSVEEFAELAKQHHEGAAL